MEIYIITNDTNGDNGGFGCAQILTRLPDFVKLPAQNDRWRIRCCARLLFWSPCSSRWHPNSCASNLVELHCLKTEIYQQQIYLRVLGLLEFQKHTSPIQWYNDMMLFSVSAWKDSWISDGDIFIHVQVQKPLSMILRSVQTVRLGNLMQMVMMSLTCQEGLPAHFNWFEVFEIKVHELQNSVLTVSMIDWLDLLTISDDRLYLSKFWRT